MIDDLRQPLDVMILGDSAGLTTGFANVIKRVAAALTERGHRLAQVCSLDVPPTCDSRPLYELGIRPFFPSTDQPLGINMYERAAKECPPDVVFFNGDAGTAFYWAQAVRHFTPDVPMVGYIPVEGAPIDHNILSVWRDLDYPITYTEWSSAALAAAGVAGIPYVYHGVDPVLFRPLAGGRDEQRRRFGWSKDFVISYVGRNNGRKGHDRLLRAAAMLYHGGMTDLRLYLHCVSYDHGWNGGWNLARLAKWLRIDHRVEFAPFEGATRGDDHGTVARRLAASDLYVHAAKIEGFGLPLLEAMACGVPVVHVNDGGNMNEVTGGAALATIGAHDIEIHSNGAELFVMSPETIARAIAACRANPRGMDQARLAGRDRACSLSWENMTAVLCGEIETAGKHGRTERIEDDTAEYQPDPIRADP